MELPTLTPHFSMMTIEVAGEIGLECGVRSPARLAVIVLDGEVDIATAPGLAQRLAPLAGTGSNLVLDLAGVRFCDCAGLNMLLGLRRLASTGGGSLHLAAPTARLRRMIALARLDDVLPLAASAAEVISALGENPISTPPLRHSADHQAAARPR